MLSRLLAGSLAQPLLVVLLALAVAGYGGWCFSQLPIDAYPDIAPTQVELILKAPGMTPEEVESRVATPLEMELLGIPKTALVRTTVKYAIADITLNFVEGTDIYWARQQVAERFNGVQASLPGTVSGGLAPMATPLSDLFMFTIDGGDLSLAQRRTLLDWTIRPALRTIPGVADLNALGGEVRSWVVSPDRMRLSNLGLQFGDVVAALNRNNRNDGSGRLQAGDNNLIVRVAGAIQSLDDLRQVVITARNGIPIQLGDVATIKVGALTRYGAVTKDGRGEAVEGLVIGLRGADASKVVPAVEAKLAQLQPSLPAGVHLSVFYNRSSLIHRAVGTVQESLAEASVLVVILLLLFLGNLRAALVVSITLPMAALMTFMCMRLAGISANLMSLGGLAIAIGMLVDGAVVVVENAVSRLAHGPAGVAGLQRQQVLSATREVAVPVISGVLIIGLVFTPLLSLQGLEGRLFVPVALTISFALGSALLLALTLIPVLCALVLRPGPHREPWLMRRAEAIYRPSLDWTLEHPRQVLLAALAGLLLAALAYLHVGKTFMPTMNEGDLIIQWVKQPSISLDRSKLQDLAIEKAIKQQVPEVSHVIARLGSDELGLDPMGLNETDMFLQLQPRSAWRVPSDEWLQQQLRQVLGNFPGLEYSFSQPIQMRIDDMLSGSRGDLAVKIYGPDITILDDLGRQVATLLGTIPGHQDVIAQGVQQVQYLSLHVDAEAAGRQGLDVNTVQDELHGQLEGIPAGIVMEQQRRAPLIVRGDGAMAANADQFAALSIGTAHGQVPLRQLAQLTEADGPVQINRENGSRFALVQANVTGRDLVGFVRDAQTKVHSRLVLPAGYSISWGGQFENQQRAAARLAMVVPMALGLILLVLYFTFGRLREALLILCNVPFALVGGSISLWISGQYLSVPAAVGFIALLGIAVLNGLVLVAHFRELAASGLPLAVVIREGAVRRLRPVLMTASITALGLLPLLFARGPGSEIQRPLAVVVMGGLLTSTALTLLLLPLLYRRFGYASGESAGPKPTLPEVV